MDYKFGALQSPPDYRDFMYRLIKPEPIKALPPVFSRRAQMGPARDQGQYGSCVGFGSCGVKDAHEGLRTSPLYVYKKCKERDGIPTEEGTYPRVAMGVLKDLGICTESMFPYVNMSWPTMPSVPAGADAEAAKYKIGAYARTMSLDEVKQSLVEDGPVLCAILVCDSFINSTDGMIPVPGTNGADYIRGGHCMAVAGYDDTKSWGGYTGFLEVKNSWSTQWGDADGYCWIPYDFFNARDIDTGMTYWMESWTSVDIFVPLSVQEGFLWIDNPTAVLDGVEYLMDQPPTINPATNRTLVPLRFLAEHFGYQVDWDGSARLIHFYKR